ncbi:hypothetical protein M23134_01050 [Microscilla marina ATCC 23134]|uniref:Uncharacterized protein n=1 Tax=Microscilla marina ATCC 23134 TaxID=313606 RepID=A1ZFF2_MICM2|nr:hypothetical protein M23134_01050 [Microscilla marina ATCC 23134]
MNSSHFLVKNHWFFTQFKNFKKDVYEESRQKYINIRQYKTKSLLSYLTQKALLLYINFK